MTIADSEARTEINLGPQGLKLTERWKTLSLGADGLKMYTGSSGECKLGADGFVFELGAGRLVIGQKIEMTGWAKDDLKQNIKPPNMTVSIKKDSRVSIGKDGLEVECKGVGFHIGPDGLVLKAGAAELQINTDLALGIRLLCSAASVDINNTGLHLAINDTTIEVTGEGLVLAAEGYTVSIGKGGFEFNNEAEPFNLIDVLGSAPRPNISIPFDKFLKIDVPALPALPKPSLMPSLPGIPSAPSLPSLGSFGKKKEAGKLEDHLEEGEQVVEGPVDIKRRSKLFSKKVVKMVKTDKGRFIVMSDIFSEIRQVYEFGGKARVAAEKTDVLKFVDAKGKAYPMIFTTESDRDKWKGLFEEAIAAAG
jgi:hypothetical protein